jgi:hypothetical protein
MTVFNVLGFVGKSFLMGTVFMFMPFIANRLGFKTDTQAAQARLLGFRSFIMTVMVSGVLWDLGNQTPLSAIMWLAFAVYAFYIYYR